MQRIKENYKQILCYILSVAIFYLLNNANIGNVVSPFAYALFFSLLFCGAKALPLSLCYAVAIIPSALTMQNIICCVCVILIANVISLYYSKTQKPKNVIAYCVACVLSVAVTIYFAYINQQNILLSCVSILLGLAFLLSSVNVLSNIFNRGINTKLTLDESICAGIIIVVLGIGLASITYFNNFLLLFVGTLIVLFVTFGFSNLIGLLCALCLGIGASLYFNNLRYIQLLRCY